MYVLYGIGYIAVVALRKESVDRNIACSVGKIKNLDVALRKESVDRNLKLSALHAIVVVSLSARRAWIEIFGPLPMMRQTTRRSPQGERG